jgi:hypothetical protein
MKCGNGKEKDVFYLHNRGILGTKVYACKNAGVEGYDCKHTVCGNCYREIRDTWSHETKKANGRKPRSTQALEDVTKQLDLS